MLNSGLFTSNSDNWSTPQDLFDKLDSTYHFDIDICADDFNHKCPIYFTKDFDGLCQDTDGYNIWCNPPYGRSIINWVRYCYFHKGLAVMLLPARTDTKWFHDYIYNHAEIHFIRGRLKFGGSTNSAPFPSMVVVFRS